eukprot:78320-Pyramimonas_sp.AAC.1
MMRLSTTRTCSSRAFFEQYRRGKLPKDPLWSFSQMELGNLIAKAARVCHLETVGIAPCSLRHAGPSWDVIANGGSQLE